MTHPNEQRITELYTAFKRRDGAAMAACYHPKARFSDPVFPSLDAAQVGAMWRMFCEGKDSDLAVEVSGISADDRTGKAHWDAFYTFPTTGRKVVNRIDASFELEDGLIVSHVDRFDLWKWTRMALGPTGLFLGWTPLVRNKVRGMARKRLDEYMARGA